MPGSLWYRNWDGGEVPFQQHENRRYSSRLAIVIISLLKVVAIVGDTQCRMFYIIDPSVTQTSDQHLVLHHSHILTILFCTIATFCPRFILPTMTNTFFNSILGKCSLLSPTQLKLMWVTTVAMLISCRCPTLSRKPRQLNVINASLCQLPMCWALTCSSSRDYPNVSRLDCALWRPSGSRPDVVDRSTLDNENGKENSNYWSNQSAH